MGIDGDAVRLEGQLHLRVHQSAQRKHAIGDRGISRHTNAPGGGNPSPSALQGSQAHGRP